MQFDMFGGVQVTGAGGSSTPVMDASGVWKTPESLAFDAALRAGSLSDSVSMMKNLTTEALNRVLLESGFTLAYAETRKGLLASVSPQIVEASRRGMSGRELRQAHAAESAKLAEARGDESFNPANYAVAFMPTVRLGDFVTGDDGFNYVVASVLEEGGGIRAARPMASFEKNNSVWILRLTQDAAKLAKERYVVERARAVKDESPVFETVSAYSELIASRFDLSEHTQVRVNGLIYQVVFEGLTPSSDVDVERLLSKEDGISRVEALTLPRAVAVAAARDFFPDVASFNVELAKSQVAVTSIAPVAVLEIESGGGRDDFDVVPALTPVVVTPELAADFTRGVRVVDGSGVVYEAFSARHGYLQAFPVDADGKALVFSGNAVYFHLDPGSASAFPLRRHDPVFVAPVGLLVETANAEDAEVKKNPVANFSNPLHTAFIDDAVIATENKENENEHGERRDVRASLGESDSGAWPGGMGDRGSLDVGLAGSGSGLAEGEDVSGVFDRSSGQGSGRSDRRTGEREASGGSRALEAGGDSAVSARGSSLTDVVVVPARISEAIAADMGKQKARVLRLRTIASVSGATLDQRRSLQAKEKSADNELRQMRLAVFDVEDEALRAIEARDASLFGVRSVMFPLTSQALAGHVASLGPARTTQATPGAEVDPFIGREFNTIWGRAKIVSLVSKAKPDYGMLALYEYKTPDDRYFRVYEDKIEASIAKHEFDATPEGMAATEAGTIAYEAKQAAILTAQAAAVEVKAVLDAQIAKFVDGAGYTPLKAGLARKMLLTQIRHEGQVLHRFEFVEKLIASGYQPVITEEDRIKPMTRRAFNQATGFEQDQHEKRVLAAGKKTVYRLETADSGFDIGAFEYAFAQHALQSRSFSAPEIAVIDAESEREIADAASKNQTMATDADLAHLFGSKDVPRISEGARVRYTDSNLNDVLSPGIIEGVVVNADSTSVGNVRYRIRTDVLGQGGHPIERMVYSHQGTLDVLPTVALESSTAVPVASVADFVITDDDRIGLGGLAEKFRDNLRAIQLVRLLDAENRTATPDEMGELARYVGWGGLKGVFDPNNRQWVRQHATLKSLLSDVEWAAASRSQLDAHFTSPIVVKAMYSAVSRLGFEGGRVLESSVGVGNFFGMMPTEIRQASDLHGVELDVLTSQIVAALYPSATIAKGTGFQSYDVPSGYFDMTIGNPPFGSTPIIDEKGSVYSGWSVHNYFFAKNIEMLRPGGIMPMVVTHNFLDKLDPHVRQWISRRAELISGVRLPNTAFKENANTEVVTDILVFRRLDFENTLGGQVKPDWLDTTDVMLENPKTGEHETLSVNNYFLNNPQNVLGTQSASGNMYRGNEYTVDPNGDLGEQLAGWVATLPQGIYVPLDRTLNSVAGDVQNEADVSVPDAVKEGSFFVFQESVYQRTLDRFGEKRAHVWTPPNQKAIERMRGMIAIRDALREQLRIERSEESGTDIEASRTALNRVYDDFKKEFGFANDQVNKRLFHDDTESALVQSLEFNYEKAITPAKALEMSMEPRPAKSDKADIFSRRVLFPPGEIEVVETAKDALLHSLNYTGGVDMAYMQRAYGKDESAIVAELGDLLFVDPEHGLVTSDSYLSGDVKTKLASVEKAAASDPVLSRNVEALKAIIPADKLPSEIHAAIGAAWIPTKVFSDFAFEISGGNTSFTHVTATGNWFSGSKSAVNFAKNNSDFGTEHMGALDILLLTMNSKAPEIKKTIERDGHPVSVTDEVKTEAVRQKADKIKAHWDSWLWSDGPRADELTAIFNDRFNRTVERKYDGSHLTFPGMTSSISLLGHQKNGVWRGLQDRVMLMDQVVGAGKTYEGVAMMMEMRRLGITKKPMIAVPNHLTLQWRSEFYKLYPGANVLAATPQDFDKENRERFFSKITTGNWDAVIVGHSSLKKLQVPIEAEQKIIKEQFDDLSKAIGEIKEARGDRNIIRDMEKIKANLEAKILKLKEKGGTKDNVVDFSDMGVDALFIDEMHEFKNLFFTTQMNRVAGLGNPAGSGKAFDLFVKIRWLQETFGQGAPLIAATGTPISNSLAEMFTMQRYMQYAKLKSNGLHVFDTWAKQYGDVQNVYEVALSGSGYRLSQRFAKFKNLGSLMGEYRSFSDVITLDDLKAQEAALGKTFPVPKLEGGKPRNIIAERSELQVKFFGIPEIVRNDAGEIVFELNADLPTSITKNSEGRFVVKQVDTTDAGKTFERVMGMNYETEQEAAYQAALAAVTPKMTIDPNSIVGQFDNIAAITRETKGKINALSLTSLANKAGLDYRLIDAQAPDFLDSKVNQAVTNILATAKAWESDKGTQLVFCDLSVPLSAKAKMASKEKRIYVRDSGGGLTHKKGTFHTVKSHDGLSYFMVQEGKGTSKSFTMYDPLTGVIFKEGLDSKTAGVQLVSSHFSRANGLDEWMTWREKMPAITQEEIDDYKNERELDTEGDSADVELSQADIEGASGVGGFSIYDDMKAKLVAQGFPEHQIQFIHDFDTPQAKDLLFKRVNSGEVRVLFGSTPKMGAGTNVQERLVALHHIDAPWRPSDLEQREGRIIRRGNHLYARDPEGFRIEVNRYATSQTYDTRRWQLLEHKAAGLAQLRNYSGASEIEDVANEAANSADMKAAASGNPLILKETQLSNDVKRFRMLERAHRDGDYMKRSMLNSNLSFANSFGPNLITGFEALQTQRDSAPTLGIYGSHKLADKEAVMDALDTIKSRINSLGAPQVLIYRGLKFEFSKNARSIYDKMDNPDGTGQLLDVFSRSGIATRMENWCNKLDWEIEATQKKIDAALTKAGEIQTTLGQPFTESNALALAIEEHGKVQRALMKANSLAAVKPADAVEFAAAVAVQKSKLLAMGFGEALAEMEKGEGAELVPAIATPSATDVPQTVKNQVQWALSRLKDVERALDGVQRARGNGHFLALEIKDQEINLVRPNEILDEFREKAQENGVDADALILELGGVPDLARFSVGVVAADIATSMPTTSQTLIGDIEQFIKVAADSIGELRKTDVFRVLVESNRSEFRESIASYIKANRPDLVSEVDAVLYEALAEELVRGSDGVTVGIPIASLSPVASVQVGPDIAHLKTRMVEGLDVEIPTGWIVMNAPRPLLGHKMIEGEFLTGRFYAGIDLNDSMAESYIRENEKLDARLVVVLARDDQMEVALKDNVYRDKYLEIEPGKRFDMLRSSFEKVRDMPYGQLMDTLKATKGVVAEGLFSGAILEVAHGIATQKMNRDGGTAMHDLAKLNFVELKVGDVVDIKYEGGVGIVANIPAKSIGVGR